MKPIRLKLFAHSAPKFTFYNEKMQLNLQNISHLF